MLRRATAAVVLLLALAALPACSSDCDALGPRPDDVEVVGVLIDRDGDVGRFEVREVRQGDLRPGDELRVRYDGGLGFLDEGRPYLVRAALGEGGERVSTVPTAEDCPGVTTREADGTGVETSLFSRVEPRRWLAAVALPVAAMFLVLWVLALAARRLRGDAPPG